MSVLMEQFCRLCAERKPLTNMVEVHESAEPNLNLAWKISTCFLLEISTADSLPRHVCQLCSDRVLSTYEFREQIQRAQNILKNYASSISLELLIGNDTNEFSIATDCSSDKLISEKNIGTVEMPIINKKGLRNTRRKSNVEIKSVAKAWKEYNWQCYECNEQITSVKALRTHFADVHKKPTQYMCMECPKVFDIYDRFKSHVRMHRNKFSCEKCGKCCVHRNHLKHHILTHSNATPYHCQQCTKSFKTSRSLYNHQLSHLPNEMKYKHECDICHKKFTTHRILVFHRKIHSGIQEYICDQCGRDFRQKTNLDQHIITHLDVSLFHCEQCPRSFKNVYRLRKHQKSHTDEKPHECGVCRRAFREKRAMIRHSKIHTGELPHECEFCKKRFRLKSFLKIHLRQHTGERPYACLECNHHFANSSNFSKHMKGRHGINNFSTAEHRQFPFTS